MAGRKAKTAVAVKPKATSKAKARAKAPAKPKAPVEGKPSVSKTPTKKAAARKTPAKNQISAKKQVAKKAPAARKPAAKKPVAKKLAAKKPATKKLATKKSPAKTARSTKAPLRAVDKVVVAARTIKRARAVQATGADAKILSELGDLAKYIRDAKREIASIRPDNVKDEHLPKAADELDAVVAATADATNNIMDACEVVEGVMTAVSPDLANQLMDATTRIYEACSFQDITGQRIGKVVTTMKHIEDCIDALIAAFGAKGARARKKVVQKNTAATQQGKAQKLTDADLLEGPQLGKNAKSQAEIDDLFASFD